MKTNRKSKERIKRLRSAELELHESIAELRKLKIALLGVQGSMARAAAILNDEQQ